MMKVSRKIFVITYLLAVIVMLVVRFYESGLTDAQFIIEHKLAIIILFITSFIFLIKTKD